VDLQDASEWLPGRDRTPEERFSARQQVAAVWSAISGLSEKQRTVFLLHFLEEMSAAEIAAATGISRAAIKVHLFRAVHAVREKLERTR
jgi:RNA polymerase sigma-70 factor (ECF subfamily)